MVKYAGLFELATKEYDVPNTIDLKSIAKYRRDPSDWLRPIINENTDSH